MWVHLININRPEFGIFSHLYWDLLEDEEKFRGFFRMNIEQFYRLSQLVGEDVKTIAVFLVTQVLNRRLVLVT
jgi:hypothetical protein